MPLVRFHSRLERGRAIRFARVFLALLQARLQRFGFGFQRFYLAFQLVQHFLQEIAHVVLLFFLGIQLGGRIKALLRESLRLHLLLDGFELFHLLEARVSRHGT